MVNTTNPPRILVVGSMNIDLVLEADRIPSPGESYFGSDYRYIPGGKGANQAVAAAKMGAAVTFAGRVGRDGHGERLIANLREQGIDTSLVSVDGDAPTGLAVIFVEPTGDNRIMVFPGANMRIRRDDLREAFAAVHDAILINFEIPDDVILAVLDVARTTGIPLILDAGPARAFDFPQGSALEIVSPNETEAEALTGITCATDDGAAAAARVLMEQSGAKFVVIKLGKRGALIHSRGGDDELVESCEVHAIDATAAGDAFTAAMTVKLLEGADIREAVSFGTAAGAIATTRMGAQPSLPSRAETEAFRAPYRGTP